MDTYIPISTLTVRYFNAPQLPKQTNHRLLYASALMDSHIVIRVGLGSGLRDRYVQDERYFAMEHRDVRREAYEWPPVC